MSPTGSNVTTIETDNGSTGELYLLYHLSADWMLNEYRKNEHMRTVQVKSACQLCVVDCQNTQSHVLKYRSWGG